MIRLKEPRGRPGRYPWDKWFKKSKIKLIRGVDFTCMPHSMAQQIRNAATRRGRLVSVSIHEDVVLVQMN